ncbi:MAG TPA: divalent-cation tolerance protein CutA [Clostridia bacterium]|nr:divalent-cation tolerance protein CutA [Clostridia bacterium]
MTDTRLLLSTAGSREEAKTIAHALVERRHAACVNLVGPLESIYRWKGEVESAAEFLLLIKTTVENVAAVRDDIRELHSYELPECIAIDITDGCPDYLRWIVDSVR